MTYEEILERMLAAVPGTVDKREGSIIYDALAPAAVEMKLMYIELETIMQETFADTASRTYLVKRCAERGITPNAATKAVLKGVFNIDVTGGDRFSLEDLNYIVTEKIAAGEFKLQCETAGTVGGSLLGTLIPIDYIEGLTSAELTEVLIPGEDEETTDALRARYFESLESQAFGGNVADYKEKTNLLAGVGGVKVYPTWDGGGTVKLVILDSDYGVPSGTLVTTVQTAVDPVGNSGEGVGFAPIGHVVTIEGVTEASIDVGLDITYQSGWLWADIQSYVEAAIDAYFLELKQEWEDQDNIIVRVSQIETRLLDIEGVLDLANTTLDAVQANYTVAANSIPVRGVVSD